MDFSSMVSTVRSISSAPQDFWKSHRCGDRPLASTYKEILVPLVVAGGVAEFIKTWIFGVSIPMVGTVRLGFGTALYNFILSSILVLVTFFVAGVILHKLAGKFGGQISRDGAIEFVALSSAVALAAKILVLVPWVGYILALLGAFYSIYILWLGIPSQTEVIPMNRPKFLAAFVGISIVMNILVGLMVAKPTDTSFSFTASDRQMKFDSGDLEKAASQFQKEADKLRELMGGAK